MIKTGQDKVFALQTLDEAVREDVVTIVELSEEDAGLVGGGPQVDNDTTYT